MGGRSVISADEVAKLADMPISAAPSEEIEELIRLNQKENIVESTLRIRALIELSALDSTSLIQLAHMASLDFVKDSLLSVKKQLNQLSSAT